MKATARSVPDRPRARTGGADDAYYDLVRSLLVERYGPDPAAHRGQRRPGHDDTATEVPSDRPFRTPTRTPQARSTRRWA